MSSNPNSDAGNPGDDQLDWDPEVAVRIQNLSKVYTIWKSPRARLMHPLMGIARKMLPARVNTKVTTDAPYQNFYALQDVSLDIKKGESWGFLGVNGSGKSTLLKIISGNLRPTTGQVMVDGKVGIVDYSAGISGEFTGRENIFMKGAIMGLPESEIRRKMESIVDFADIGQFMDQPTKTYSSGMCARLGFAIMAHMDNDILISDEALAVGDAFFVQKCMKHIRAFIKRGTFLFVSHSVESVLSLCSKAVWLEHGRVMAIGDANGVVDKYISSHVIKGSKASAGKRGAETDDSGGASVSNRDEEEVEDGKSNGQAVEVGEAEMRSWSDCVIPKVIRDGRIDAPPNSQWAGELEISEFDSSDEGAGIGGAEILDVGLFDDEGACFSHVVGGEMVNLEVRARAERDLERPIVGFTFKNSLGLALFGDNTLLTRRIRETKISKGRTFVARFTFQMPLLRPGEYMLTASVAEGEKGDVAVLRWHNPALVVRCVTSAQRNEIVGLPMQRIRLEVEEVVGSRITKS